ncbi:MAG: hypothetical protein A2521_13595 [Deltaproteobacteria bacterium RIFOXYD12_FULL_57_12]|nr:MAG: hypothetical protein A2521_13595 [Deltaproteobacteria bacterium RIFOXYD12_FULL_57_12]
METQQVKILCVDDERNVLKALRRLFMEEDYELLVAESGEEGLASMAENPDVQLVISDYRMPGMNGVDFLQQVYKRWPDTVRIVLSGYADTAAVVGAINEGQIYKFIPKPWNDEELKNTIAKALEVQALRLKNLQLARELEDSNEELQRINANLEHMVEERTAELVFQNRVLSFGQNMLDCLPVGVLGLDTSGMVMQCNTLGFELLGRAGSEVIGLDFRQLLPEELATWVADLQGNDWNRQTSVAGRALKVRGARLRTPDGQHGTILVLEPE